MRVNWVELENFRSFGNEVTRIDFVAGRTLVIGSNGAGKTSSVLEATCFSLFGVPFNSKITKTQLVNTITGKGMVTRASVESFGRSYTITRGMKPTKLQVVEHTPEGDMAIPSPGDSRDYQEWIEREVLRMSVHTFRQIVMLSTKDRPFMRMDAEARRKVTEDVLDIQVFTVMNKVLKERADVLKVEIADAERKLELAQRVLEVEERAAAARSRDTAALVAEKEAVLQGHLNAVEGNRATLLQLEAEAAELSAEIEGLNQVEDTLLQMEQIHRKLVGKHNLSCQNAEFFKDSEVCPTCAQEIASSFARAKEDEHRQRAERFADGISRLDEEIEKTQAELAAMTEKAQAIARLNRAIVDVNSTVRNGLSIIEGLRADIERLGRMERQAGEAGDLPACRAAASAASAHRDVLLNRARVMGAAGKMLKDGGIKTSIIREYIPEMNRLLNEYLGRMDLFVDFNLDENFNEYIRSRHRDTFSYEMFSAGEQLRIDLAILFTWREIARQRTGASINLLVFDEMLDSSLDDEGVEEFLKVIGGLTSDQCVFIISHRQAQQSDRFDRTLRFVKRSNFSGVEEVTE